MHFLYYAEIIYFALMIIVSFALMGIDKLLSKKEGRRIPEKTFFLLSLLGGALGVALGMGLFKHKTQKRSFLLVIPLLLILNIAAAIGLAVLVGRLIA